MHGPTCIFWANLTAFTPKVCPGRSAVSVKQRKHIKVDFTNEGRVAFHLPVRFYTGNPYADNRSQCRMTDRPRAGHQALRSAHGHAGARRRGHGPRRRGALALGPVAALARPGRADEVEPVGHLVRYTSPHPLDNVNDNKSAVAIFVK